ncbi:helix-turn-helix transcriptional regulator [Aquibium microcysteis]|uniref:helix-turn-helix transcriptional regulator n=1 Tax=Aquibium microcysteis TaxID=675281 RepID=UPI00165D1F5F|nr:LuxR C-terminal-related transcriptional regulator [Aquibium microcysteis]
MLESKELAGVRVRSPEGVKDAALCLKQAIVQRLGDWRVATTSNIASRRAMCDADGRLLATEVFGWTERAEDSWWRRQRLALESPLPTACRYESEPMWCNALGFRSLSPNPMLHRIDVSDFARRAFCNAAIVVPVHMPFGRIGAASVVPRDASLIDLERPFSEHGEAIGQLCRTFVTSHANVMDEPSRLPVGVTLSRREVECLRWAAVGKTDLEIGMIISRSRATIRFHMHNATAKLDAVSRSQAVFKAAQLGYISLGH